VCSTFQPTAIKITHYHRSRRFIILTTWTCEGRRFPHTLGTHSRNTFNCYRIYLIYKGKILSVQAVKAHTGVEVWPVALLPCTRRRCMRSWRSVSSNTEETYRNSPLVTRLIGRQKEYGSLDQEKNALPVQGITFRFLGTRTWNANLVCISKI